MYGCALPNQEEEEAEEGVEVEAARGFMFAPHDVAPWQFVAKDDNHGIGYQGMEQQDVLQSKGMSHSVYGMSGKVRTHRHTYIKCSRKDFTSTCRTCHVWYVGRGLWNGV